MSRGPGHVQRAILDLVEDNPGGAWTTSDLCFHVFGDDEKTQRVAVLRAIRTMQFPAGWGHYRMWKAGRERCLYNVWSVEGETEFRRLESWPQVDRERWLEGWPHIAERAAEAVAKRIEYRDAGEAGQIRLDMASLRQQIALLASAGTSSAAAYIKEVAARIAIMQARLSEIEAAT